MQIKKCKLKSIFWPNVRRFQFLKVNCNLLFEILYRFIFDLIFQQSTQFLFLMRKRSGGFHCESEQQYIDVAILSSQLAANKNTSYGLFYNEQPNCAIKKRRKYGISLDRDEEHSMNLQQKGHDTKTSSNAFKGFDFDEQTYTFNKDCEALLKSQKQFSTKAHKSHYTIISELNPIIITGILSDIKKPISCSKQTPEITKPHPPLQLFIDQKIDHNTQNIHIDCFWVIDYCQMKDFQCLFDIYISTSAKIINLHDSLMLQGKEDDLFSKQYQQLQQKIRDFVADIESEREQGALQY